MDVFDLREKLISDYSNYTNSFIKVSDEDVAQFVKSIMDEGRLWPEPLLQLNPSFKPGGTVASLVSDGTLHSECGKIFRVKSPSDPGGTDLTLHTHQVEAIRLARKNLSYVLTSGTGSGKSLTYIIPIVDHILRRGANKGVQAIVVYPMNALANSQEQELRKFLSQGYGEGKEPVTFARFTGQESPEERTRIRQNPPDILLTNYMMLELMLTRVEDRELVRASHGLKFLVFDELHTYRGRQGADVSLLFRRARNAFEANDLICVGTSATMSSGGTSADQKNEVARVASTIFGTTVKPDQVVHETLIRATKELDFKAPANLAALKSVIQDSGSPPSSYAEFCASPVASWIESVFGVRTEAATGLLVRQSPRRLSGDGGAAAELSKQTGVSEDICFKRLKTFLLTGSMVRKNASDRFPVLAFRLHQFLTRGDTVWSTIEPQGKRYLHLGKLGSRPGEQDKLLYPMVFCRLCGATYLRAGLAVVNGKQKVLPRDGRRVVFDEEPPIDDIYVYVSGSKPWPQGDGPDLLSRLPDLFKQVGDDGKEKIISDKKGDLPEPVFINASGNFVSEGMGITAALIPGNFHFCLDCGGTYAKTQRSERSKLLTLGVDSRSTATTILAVRVLRELQADAQISKEARKLLSFTDNRQDASLQAGHFNDFSQIALLRSALFRAAKEAGSTGLQHGALAAKVFQSMSLPFEEYAADPEVRGPAKTQTDDALRRVIDYQLYRDLKRGWRVTAPNLEETGLLVFDYEGLRGADGLLNDADVWGNGFKTRIDGREESSLTIPPSLSSLPAESREEIVLTVLDILRRGLAIKVDCLNPAHQQALVQDTKPRLQEGTVWFLEDERDLEKSSVAFAGPRPSKNPDRHGLYLSSFGRLGRYLRKRLKVHYNGDLRGPEIDAVLNYLLFALKRYGIVEQVRSGDRTGFQLNHGALRWIASDGTVRPVDKTRLLESGEEPPAPNPYFVSYYQSFVDLQCMLEGREHTAQVAPEIREQREEDFRAARLPLLFCSPTMELGVDISLLNVVNLRNVPPTPANYAQRSGRAGRGGQPALVYSYCAGQSPHDQYYFRAPEKMVTGSVAAPRIDLRNENLVRAHVHAVWMEVAKPDLKTAMTAVLDIINEDGKLSLPLKPEISRALSDSHLRAEARSRAQRLLDAIPDELTASAWYHPNWLDQALSSIPQSFDAACERWRSLYRAADSQQRVHNRIVMDHSRPELDRERSRALRAQAETQIRLLTTPEGVREGDFYSYRYFATEGFLPGYNFPRLPLSAFVPARRGRRGRDEFVSRPRFLAISEFGPRALVYHEGAQYRVHKVNLDHGSADGGLVTYRMKRCTSCGYGHLESGTAQYEICEHCGSALEPSCVLSELIHLQNVSLRLARRINCDEEERQRQGYRLSMAYRFAELNLKVDRHDAEASIGEKAVATMSYGDAATLYRINEGWAKTDPKEPKGFILDLEKGFWASNPRDEDDPKEADAARRQRVIPFVMDTKNALVFVPKTQNQDEMAVIQAAFKQAIQKEFQIEPSELAAEPLPSRTQRKEILFFEVSEGGAGVLRQIVENPAIAPILARRALEVLHFNPDTLEDLGATRCGKACYECVLDYGNQPDHGRLDRHLAKTFFKALMGATVKASGGQGSRSDRLAALKAKCESGLERRWLEQLDAMALQLPSHAQSLVDGCQAQPDFLYREKAAVIFVDGPAHDEPHNIRKDEDTTKRLMDAGYVVIRFHHKADWKEIFKRHPDIFGSLAG